VLKTEKVPNSHVNDGGNIESAITRKVLNWGEGECQRWCNYHYELNSPVEAKRELFNTELINHPMLRSEYYELKIKQPKIIEKNNLLNNFFFCTGGMGKRNTAAIFKKNTNSDKVNRGGTEDRQLSREKSEDVFQSDGDEEMDATEEQEPKASPGTTADAQSDNDDAMASDSGDDEASTHSDQVSPRQKRRRLHSPPKDNSTANVADSQLLWQIQLKEIELEQQQLAMERKKLELEKKILLQQQKDSNKRGKSATKSASTQQQKRVAGEKKTVGKKGEDKSVGKPKVPPPKPIGTRFLDSDDEE